MTFTFVIPGVVKSTNHGYKIGYHGGHPTLVKADGVEAWQTEVSYRTRQAKPSGWKPGRRVKVTYSVWFARKGRDADGILKFLLDGIATGLGIDDDCFLFECVSNEVDKVFPRVEVTIE